MKRLLFAILIFAPMLSMAQNNTWEVPQQETSQQTKASKTVNKVSKVQKTDDPKYLAGAITLNSDVVLSSQGIPSRCVLDTSALLH